MKTDVYILHITYFILIVLNWIKHYLFLGKLGLTELFLFTKYKNNKSVIF